MARSTSFRRRDASPEQIAADRLFFHRVQHRQGLSYQLFQREAQECAGAATGLDNAFGIRVNKKNDVTAVLQQKEDTDLGHYKTLAFTTTATTTIHKVDISDTNTIAR